MDKYDVYYYLERIGIEYQEDENENFIIVIPNEETLNIEPECITLSKMDSHGKKLEEFSNKHHLNIDKSTLNIRDDFYGNQYQIAIASLGHIVICIDEQIWTFIPDTLTEKQIEIFKRFKGMFLEAEELYYAIYDQNRSIVDERDMVNEFEIQNNTEDLYLYVENLERGVSR